MSGFSPAFLSSTSNSFVELARAVAPESLPTSAVHDLGHQVPEGTTLICFRTADDFSVIGIAGTAGLALDLCTKSPRSTAASASPQSASTTSSRLCDKPA